MAIAWPATLPQFAQTRGFRETLGKNTLRFQPDIGPGKTRQRQEKPRGEVSWSFLMTEAQLNEFDEFYLETLDQGALAFDFNDPATAISREYRFSESPTYKQLGTDAYSVQCNLKRKY